MKVLQFLTLTLSLSALVACQSSPPLVQNSNQSSKPGLAQNDKPNTAVGLTLPQAQDQSKDSPEAHLRRSGQTVRLSMQLPPLP